MHMKMMKFALPSAAALAVLAAVLSGAGGFSASPRPVAADTQGTPHLEIDADTTNGVCTTLDATRLNAPTSGTYTVAICLDENGGAPDAFEATLSYSGSVLGIVSAANGNTTGDALDANPDFNQAPGPAGSGTNWNCTALGFALPVATPSPAHIVCNDKSFVAGELTASPGLLATFTVTANGSGTVTFTFSTDGTSAVNSPAGTGLTCGSDMTCPGGTVVQGSGSAAATATPTATATPCTGPCPTSTPVPTGTPIVPGFKTQTPTITATSTTAAGSPAPGGGSTGGGTTGGAGGGPTTGGGPGGVISGPDTGSDGVAASGSHSWIWLVFGAIAAATALGGAAGVTVIARARADR